MVNDFKIYKKIEENKIIIEVSGSINTETSSVLNDELQKLDYSGLDLTIDFLNTDYITSAGLRVLLVARKKLYENSMRIINANDSIIDVFHITGFDSFIKIEGRNSSKNFDLGNDLSYTELLKFRANNSGNDVAYVYKEKEYSWIDVDVAATIIAKDLSKIGVKKGVHVGICGNNSINWIFVFFAIQKLGGISVLINSRLKPQEVNDVCKIGGVTHLCYSEISNVTSFDNYKKILLESNSILDIYNFSDSIDFISRKSEFEIIKNDFSLKQNADDASVIVFTSGSIGKPKAVLSSAYTLTSSLFSICNNFKFSKNDINLAFLPLFHIFGFETNIVAGLIKGYRSIIPYGKNPASMIELIDKYKCTIFNTVPTMMLEIIIDSSFVPNKLNSLRVSILGGATTTSKQMSTLMKLLPNVHFGNIYGMSENACISITDYDDTIEHLTKSVGKPVKDLEICIRDISGNILENGKQGEICIRSKSMLVCYYKLDIDKQPLDDDGWLSTGDLGYIDNDGYLKLTGRIKDLIISGGENISPGEIENVLASIPCVANVKVVGVPDEIKGEVIAAVIVLKPNFNWNESETRKFVEEKLTKYKNPKYYIVLSSMPLLGSGKIDTVALKKLVIEKIKHK